MAELGITLAERLIEVTACAIIKQICEMWGYKSQLEDLNKTVFTIKNVLLDADSKRELSHETRGYIEELKAIVYDADDLFDEFYTLAELKALDANKDDEFLKKVRRFFSGKGGKLFEKVHCCFTCENQAGQAYRMSRQVKKIRKQLDDIVSNHKFGLTVDYNPICRRKKETCSCVDAGDIIGREDDTKVVIDMLLSPSDGHESFRFVTIVGVGGLGKTALAQLVYNDGRVEAEIPDPKLRLWVCVSDQDGVKFDVQVILCKIIQLVSGKRPDDTSSMEFVQKEFQKQLRGKKYLLVLDDVWNEDCEEWRELRRFLTLGEKGSRIVVTTRSEITAKNIGEKHVHKLQGLSPKNSWLLFESVAFDKEEQEHINRPDLVEIGKKIVEKCYNIPLAIKAVGSLLFGQDVDKWQTFEHSGLAGIGNGDNKIMSILKLSYHNLTPSLKNCFSYCALFPKDYRLQRKELICLWMAQGYIVSLHRDQSIEDAAEEHFLILLRRFFFQDVVKYKYGEIGSVKIHDLMHDVALEVGREEIGMVSSSTTKLGDKVRHVNNAYGYYSQSYSIKSKIRSFFSPMFCKWEVDAHIDSWMCLRVLCLKSAGIKRLSDSIGKLLHLRYLDLSWNMNLEALSDSITRLHNLQTLNLHRCTLLKELPNDFSKLVKLMYLDLSGCHELTSMPTSIGQLTSLWHFDLSCCDFTSMPTSIGKLTSLRHFDLSRCDKLTSMPTSIGQLTSLRHLDLSCCDKLTSMPTSIGQLTSLRHLDLSDCEKLTSMPKSIGQLTSLRHLDLSDCKKLTSMPKSIGQLTSLRVLPYFVVGMKKRVSTEEQCMGELKDLKPLTNLTGGIKIKIGKYYMNDDGRGYLKGMKHLTEVEIDFSEDKVEKYFFEDEDEEDEDEDEDEEDEDEEDEDEEDEDEDEDEEDEDEDEDEDENDGCLEWEVVMEKLEPPSNLKKFTLWWYMGTTIPRWGRAEDSWALSLPHLVQIQLYYCNNLEQLPSLSKLRNLKSLELVSLHKLEYMENTSSNNANDGEDLTAFFPSLEFLRIGDLTSLKGWWREEEVVEDDDDDRILRSSFTFPRLSKLEISNCPKLTSFPSCRSLEDLGLDEVDCFGNSQGDVILRELKIDDVGLLNLINSPVNKLQVYENRKVESLSEFGDVFQKCKYTSSLRSLEISFCSNLRRVGRGGLEHLTALEKLDLTGLEITELSFSEDEVDDDGIPWKSFHQSLRSLSIRYCDAIKSLPESMRNLTSLQNLTIDGCPELKERCKEPNGEDWPKIQHIPNIKIE